MMPVDQVWSRLLSDANHKTNCSSYPFYNHHYLSLRGGCDRRLGSHPHQIFDWNITSVQFCTPIKNNDGKQTSRAESRKGNRCSPASTYLHPPPPIFTGFHRSLQTGNTVVFKNSKSVDKNWSNLQLHVKLLLLMLKIPQQRYCRIGFRIICLKFRWRHRCSEN